MMAKKNHKSNNPQVDDFLNEITDMQKRQDCQLLREIMANITGQPAQMWGDSMIGFDSYHYKYSSGREGDYFITGFSPRKQALTIYIMNGFDDYRDLLTKLGKFKTAVSCLYVKRLADIDQAILRELITRSVNDMRRTYKT